MQTVVALWRYPLKGSGRASTAWTGPWAAPNIRPVGPSARRRYATGRRRAGSRSDGGCRWRSGAGRLRGCRRGAQRSQRFRPNLVVDARQDPELGQELRIGEVVLHVILPTPRCVVPGLGHAELPPDRSVLTALARHNRVPVPGLGRAACFGTYAEVAQPGRLLLGQSVR